MNRSGNDAAVLEADWNAYIQTAQTAAAEGSILLENDGALPISSGSRLAIFGRMQNHYYKSGTGSGGMVNVHEIVSIPEGLRRSNAVSIAQGLAKVYRDWEETHPIDRGKGWGREPWFQAEMPLSGEVAENAAKEADIALVIIARTAGEDVDQKLTPGSYYLTETEWEMLSIVRSHFLQMIVVLNVGGLIDLSWIDEIGPNAVLLSWQGGMIGGAAVADVLLGITPPSGHLTDTVAYSVEDYPSHPHFGDLQSNCYREDIYVGYRYFETVAQDRVRYPFGYGRTYTTFLQNVIRCEQNPCDGSIAIEVEVENTGAAPGRDVVFAFVKAPEGALRKPARVLVGFAKTHLIAPGEKEIVHIQAEGRDYASFDDTGKSGFFGAFVLEAGSYEIYIGEDVRRAQRVHTFELSKLLVLEDGLGDACFPVEPFERMVILDGKIEYEAATFKKGGEALHCEQDENYDPEMSTNLDEKCDLDEKCRAQEDTKVLTSTLMDVKTGHMSLDTFVKSLSDEDLCCIVRGEGMGSPKVVPGTASAFAGISERLKARGIPAICCDDGPSGMRLDSGVQAFALPIGTLLASTFDIELVERLYGFTSIEMVGNQVDILLGPGMNIHRHPLNGRNFEYFSEDPLVSGKMAQAVLKGLASQGASGCMKHFCANNQEAARTTVDAVVSGRALREIYLRPYEMVVRHGISCAIMTSYGRLNGLYTATHTDLTHEILRKQWGFSGIVMTDWWADLNGTRDAEPNRRDYASMVRSENDLYMCCPKADDPDHDDNLAESLANKTLSRKVLERSAKNICRFAMNTRAFDRMNGENVLVMWKNKPKSPDDVDISTIEMLKRADGEDLVVDLSGKPCGEKTNFVYKTDLGVNGVYEVSLSGASPLSRVAQVPCTLFVNGVPMLTFSFRGTSNEVRTLRFMCKIKRPDPIIRLYVARDGVELEEFRMHYIGPLE